MGHWRGWPPSNTVAHSPSLPAYLADQCCIVKHAGRAQGKGSSPLPPPPVSLSTTHTALLASDRSS
jgi:hypothetical protein